MVLITGKINPVMYPEVFSLVYSTHNQRKSPSTYVYFYHIIFKGPAKLYIIDEQIGSLTCEKYKFHWGLEQGLHTCVVTGLLLAETVWSVTWSISLHQFSCFLKPDPSCPDFFYQLSQTLYWGHATIRPQWTPIHSMREYSTLRNSLMRV